MVADALRRMLYPAFVTTIIATVWAMGHARALADQVYNRRSWPPLNPEMFEFAEHQSDEDASAAVDPL